MKRVGFEYLVIWLRCFWDGLLFNSALENHMFPLEQKLRIAYLDVVSEMAFQPSVEYWRRKSASEKRWVKINSQTKPMLIGKDDALEVDGNSMAEISAPEGGIIHVNGNVNSNI